MTFMVALGLQIIVMTLAAAWAVCMIAVKKGQC